MRILLAQNDERAASFLQRGLREEGHVVDAVRSGSAAIECTLAVPYDLLILDFELPEYSGIQVLRRVRAHESTSAVLLLTDHTSLEERITCLDCGADDCLIKPFAFAELAARVRALSRRGVKEDDPVLRVGDLELDTSTREVHRGGHRIDLRPKEYALLEYLMRNAHHPVTRTRIIEHVWDIHFDGISNVVAVHVNSLRSKLDRGQKPQLIRTLRGVGYVITDKEDE